MCMFVWPCVFGLVQLVWLSSLAVWRSHMFTICQGGTPVRALAAVAICCWCQLISDKDISIKRRMHCRAQSFTYVILDHLHVVQVHAIITSLVTCFWGVLMWLPAHCWCQLLIQIADLNCWCQLIADEDDEGSVLCGEFGRQRYLDHLDRKDLRIFPDLESIQHMLISLAPSYFWFPAAICHLILLTLCLAFPLLWPLWTRICKTCHGFSLVTSVFDCCNICQGFGQFKTSSSLNIPSSDNVFAQQANLLLHWVHGVVFVVHSHEKS